MKSDLQWMQAQVVALRDVTPTVREFELRPDGGFAAAHEPGAHLQVQVMTAQGRVQTRSYSLVGEGDGKCWRIAVKRLDDGRGGSLAMWRLAVGDRLQVSAPQNHFPLDLSAPGYLLVAGGIGITPLVLMAQRLGAHAKRTGVPVKMLYGARNAGEFGYLPHLREALGESGVEAHEGATPIDFAAAIAALPPGGQLYTCGPVPMLEAVKRAWHAAGRAIEDLRFETFGSSGRLATQPFQVRIPRHDLAITVPADCTLLEALDAAGVQTLSDCKRGECGLCAMDVISVDGEIDHRDVFLSEHEKKSVTRICACVSRAVGTLTLDSAYRADS
ncbi:PDR/VanB family oxidoreductase [Variovorax sp. NFACC27]|uniref:PDR/VanB family oxidoreductase n=1 Tax=unclassified Variovorax TaxID=663243 RepID=UPI00089D288B|nr:vanillate demethylase subunit B [Variovorax sp. NFACC28]SEG77320.1 vanillate demethylase subunit B [Variovorax sp. NFACC29]SFC98172.1 vanillate demethylase subunit B [Variovorax sp. NFACC26]SFG10721.1 vanillate demethylase subunit B [Variovorax sp. NFACC27]